MYEILLALNLAGIVYLCCVAFTKWHFYDTSTDESSRVMRMLLEQNNSLTRDNARLKYIIKTRFKSCQFNGFTL